jgi:hypothetical protein
MVTRETVAVNATYEFALKPGRYLLQAHFAQSVNVVPSIVITENGVVHVEVPATAAPWIGVTVHARQMGHVDIPNTCM